jgi:hypothetical protein
MGIDGFTTFALTGRDGFVTHPCEFAIVRKGYKPFPTFDCVVGGKLFSNFGCVFRGSCKLFWGCVLKIVKFGVWGDYLCLWED